MVSAIDSNSLAAIRADSYILVVSLSYIIDDHGATILFLLDCRLAADFGQKRC